MKWTVLTVLAGYCAWVTVWAHGEASRHICRAVEVRVDAPAPVDSIVRAGVLEEVAKYPFKIKGVPINQVDTRSVEKHLNKLSAFETVHCIVTADGTLRIDVTPMIPVMRVFFGDGSYYINKDGKHVPSNAEFFTDVPVVTGNFDNRFQPVDVLPFVRFIENDRELRALTSMVLARGPRDLLLVPRITGHVVNFGDTLDLPRKRRALLAFYRNVMPYKGWEHYDTISVKFRGQVVATRRDKTKLNKAEVSIEDIDLEEATLPETASRGTLNQGSIHQP